MDMLITGANGVVGSDLVKYFSKSNKVFAVYRSENLINKKLKNKNIKWIKHNLNNKLIFNINPKIIIHCAVTHSFSKKNSNKDLINNNLIGMQNVIEFANKKKVKQFYHLSSLNVYGEINSKLLKETNSFTNPDLLGASKIIMEKLLENQNFSYLNIRLPGIVGYQINDSRRPWISKIVNNLIKGKEIKIFNAYKLFNNIIDTYEIFNLINFLKSKNLNNQTMNMSATKPIKVINMINFLKNELNSSSKIIFDKKKSKHFLISTKKIEKNFGFKPSATKIILQRYIKSFLNS